MSDEFDSEPIRGLPGVPPEGEHILWQGTPSWRVFARRALHTRTIAFYFGILVLWSVASNIHDGAAMGDVAVSALSLGGLGAVAVALLAGFAWLVQRTTVYTITNRRVVLRFGIAFPMTVNLPFDIIESAALRQNRDGSGDIPVTLRRGQRASYVILWPHVRPRRIRRPEPMLRALPEAASAAEILSTALAEALHAAGSPAPQPASARPTTVQPPAPPAAARVKAANDHATVRKPALATAVS